MNTNEKKDRIKILENLVKKHQDLYYNSMAEISDAEFDALWDELRSLDPQNEVFFKVPKDSADGFKKAEHIVPMGSQEKAANPGAFETWAKKMPSQKFLVQYKLDGASLELQYKNGRFVKAVTRGDGKMGDDISENVKKMQGFRSELSGTSAPGASKPFSGGVRGEVIMTHKTHAEHFSDKANCRNAANGLMKKKNGEKCEHLQVICYDAVQGVVGKPFIGEAPFSNETEKVAWLKASGFFTVDIKTCNSVREVIAYREEVMEKTRATLDYDIDGLVVKMNKIDPSDMMRARPEKQIAFKFALEEATTTLTDIEWSESGATYTPIALIEPVRLAGTIVKRASLANPNIIEALNLKIGSRVLVTKRGEIIPKIEALVESPENCKEITYPEFCEACKTKLKNEGTRLFCPNINCPKLIHHRIEKWINVLDIRDFGVTLIKNLFDMGRIKSIPDLYTLTIEELSEMERMGALSAKKVYNAHLKANHHIRQHKRACFALYDKN